LSKNDIPVVFLSSHTEPEIVEKTERITSYGYVVKNSTITVLDASIKMAFKLFNTREHLKATIFDLNAKERSLQYNSAMLKKPKKYRMSAPGHGTFLKINLNGRTKCIPFSGLQRMVFREVYQKLFPAEYIPMTGRK